MKHFSVGIAVLLMLAGAALLIAGVGPSAPWYAAIAAGIALIAIIGASGAKLIHH